MALLLLLNLPLLDTLKLRISELPQLLRLPEFVNGFEVLLTALLLYPRLLLLLKLLRDALLVDEVGDDDDGEGEEESEDEGRSLFLGRRV
eukprot:CAMPEP_0168616070 /NCGR_PEP_ID=MMETSP0449_2-20121227/4837_1 /TAXON_ID=1082188 /ORGANISM="Strombidium rassoulzadegani, Strain ras09" /LENGTH=89 /DNA_ID=CAMNT_0008656843 /DNA_START=272 /DNA_END=541 /DNA_ORIENTATION=-